VRAVALPSVLHDFQIALAHVDAGLDLTLSFRVARHPSESMSRLWLRVLAECIWWREGVAPGPGLCDPDAPDVVARDLAGAITLWVRVGRPEPVRLQRESDRNAGAEVAALFEAPRWMESFVAEARGAGLSRLGRVALAAVDPPLLAALAAVEERRTRMGLTIVGDHLYVERGGRSLDGPLHRASLG
jgi:uncharacterized protein YaeQ